MPTMLHPGLVPAHLDRRRLGLAMAGLIAVAGIVAIVTGARVGDDSPTAWLLSFYGIAVYTAVGVMILWNRPGHGIGRLALAVGLAFSLTTILDGTIARLVIPGTVQPLETGWIVGVRDVARVLVSLLPAIAIGFGGILLIAWFPDGRPAGRAGVLVTILLAIAGVLGLTMAARDLILRGIGWSSALESAFFAVSNAAILCLFVAFAIAVANLVSRYRRSDPVPRAQIRWVAAAAGLCAVMTVLVLVTATGLSLEIPGLWEIWIASMMLPVLAIGIAITRYHLYDIDRIVSRSISYVVVTVVLFVVFGGLTLLLQGLITGAAARPGEPIDPRVVAASTLVVAALFNPVRVRVQRAVDRRFHRARYDTERTVAGFAGRLRDHLDLPTLTGELRQATINAVEPTTTAVWLRARGVR
jgi:hypothetical protein